MYEQKMCSTADKIYIFDKSVINTRTIRMTIPKGIVFSLQKKSPCSVTAEGGGFQRLL